MKGITLPPRAIVTHIVDKSKLGRFGVSRALGKTNTFIQKYCTEGRTPNLDTFIGIAKVCGYEVHIIGHGEDITVEVPDE